jgi:broad specificity phosphatase PhoE
MHDTQEREWEAGNHAYRIPGGESLDDVENRMVPFIYSIVEAYQGKPGTVVLVGHGSGYSHILPGILPNLPPEIVRDLPLENGAIVSIAVTDHGLFCVEWGGKRVKIR